MSDVAGTYLDRDANGDAGEEISGPFAREIYFQTSKAGQVSERGVIELPDGRIYTVTVRRTGHGDVGSGGRRRLATRMPYGTFQSVASGLLTFERGYIEPLTYASYERDVHAL